MIKSIINLYNSYKQRKQLKLMQRYERIALDCSATNLDYKKLLSSNYCIDKNINEIWKANHSDLFNESKANKKYNKAKVSTEKVKHIENLKKYFQTLDAAIKESNLQFINQEKSACKDLFDNIEGRALDEQQRECILKDEINNLVVAGAGSGKTTTIVGKVKYISCNIVKQHYG